jgi:ketosteroid isomerase-like protein
VREFFAALEAGDIPRFLKVWAEDGVQEMPYAPGRVPEALEGRAAIEKQYGPLPAAFTGMRFPLRRWSPPTSRAWYLPSSTAASASRGRALRQPVRGRVRVQLRGQAGSLRRVLRPYTLIHGFPGAAEAAMPDAERIERMILDMAKAADAKDWKTIGNTFADEVDFDYTSVAGGSPARLKREDIVAGWTQGLGRYQQTKHNFSDVAVKIEGDAVATCTFTGQATHVKGNGERWSCGGDYTYRFARTPGGWKATAARFDMKWEQGTR